MPWWHPLLLSRMQVHLLFFISLLHGLKVDYQKSTILWVSLTALGCSFTLVQNHCAVLMQWKLTAVLVTKFFGLVGWRSFLWHCCFLCLHYWQDFILNAHEKNFFFTATTWCCCIHFFYWGAGGLSNFATFWWSKWSQI